jgi:inactive phospholipase C-like protein 2
MDEIQWKRFEFNFNLILINLISIRIMDNDPSAIIQTHQTNMVNCLQRRTTFIKYRPNGLTYSRVYFLVLSEDSIHYMSAKYKSIREACMIKDIDQICPGFTTTCWRKCLNKRKITNDKSNLAFSILYKNNRQSLDLLAETEDIRLQWIQGLEFLINRYRSHMRTNREITDQWIWHLFSQADHEHSGHLNRDEIHRLLYTLNIQLSDNIIDFYFNQSNIRSRTYQELTHLDKDEFLIFYKYVSQRPELLKIICQYVFLNFSSHFNYYLLLDLMVVLMNKWHQFYLSILLFINYRIW